MLLQNKVAVVYGGGGAIGGAMATAFAREGARVFVAGHGAASLAKTEAAIRSAGGSAHTAVLDALDEAEVNAHADAVAEEAGGIDISVNVIAHGDVQGTPLADMKLADFEAPVHNALRTNYLTARAAARHMIRRGSGAILVFGGYGKPMANLGGLQVALGALEYLRRSLACELGQHGIRVVTLQTGGIPEAIPAGEGWRAEVTEAIERNTMLGRAATLADVGNVAAFAASDHAATITGSAINISCGATSD